MYRLSNGVTAELIDGCYILLKENGDAATLNETASFILDNMNKDQEHLINLFCKEYMTDHKTAQTDIEELIAELLRRELIVADLV